MTLLDVRTTTSRPTRITSGRVVVALAVLAGLAWAPFVTAPATPDEGGFLLVASQWHPGTSLYGDYWVDRPPLLIAIHALADALGGIVALRLIGILAVVASVLLAGRLGRLVAGRDGFAALAPAAIAAVFLATPLFGTTQVDGEVLTVPFVLLGLVALLEAVAAGAESRSARRWAALAGASAVTAALVKQNAIDVVVVGLALGFVCLRGRIRFRHVLSSAASTATVVLAAVLAVSAALGTGPVALWDAIVTFRMQAASVISQYSTSANSDRLHQLLLALVLSAAPLVALAFATRLVAPLRADRGTGTNLADLRLPAVALLGWEVVSVAGGGTFWLHYLLVLVPGLVLLAAAAAQREPGRGWLPSAALGLAALSALVATGQALGARPQFVTDRAVAAYLRDHSAPGATAVVGFGHPNILTEAGMTSPYDELWSLPVRVRDPQLTSLNAVLTSYEAPQWVVVSGSSLATWAVDASQADGTLREDYRLVTYIGDYSLWEHR